MFWLLLRVGVMKGVCKAGLWSHRLLCMTSSSRQLSTKWALHEQVGGSGPCEVLLVEMLVLASLTLMILFFGHSLLVPQAPEQNSMVNDWPAPPQLSLGQGSLQLQQVRP